MVKYHRNIDYCMIYHILLFHIVVGRTLISTIIRYYNRNSVILHFDLHSLIKWRKTMSKLFYLCNNVVVPLFYCVSTTIWRNKMKIRSPTYIPSSQTIFWLGIMSLRECSSFLMIVGIWSSLLKLHKDELLTKPKHKEGKIAMKKVLWRKYSFFSVLWCWKWWC